MPIRVTQPTDEDGVYYFDERAADAAVAFFSRYLTHIKGEWAGRSFELSDWQANIIRNVFGWKRSDNHTRRYRNCYIWVSRKQGKTLLAGGVALLLLLGDGEPGAEVYAIASTESQARIVYDFATQMVAQSKELSRHLTVFKTAIWCDRLGAVFRALTGKPAGKHGLSSSALIVDELHEFRDDELLTFVRQGQGTRRQPLNFVISTAGKRGGVGWETYKFCEAVLEGEITAPDTFVFIAAADAKRDADDPEYWTREETLRDANPGYGVSIKPEYLLGEVDRARNNKRLINDVKRYHLGLWVDQATVWLDMTKWDKCGHRNKPPVVAPRSDLSVIFRGANMRWTTLPEMLKGRRCLGGLDLSSTTDLTALVLVFPPTSDDPMWYVLPHFYLPRENIEDKTKRDAFDYLAHEAAGAITLTDGDVVDYDVVRAGVVRARRDYALEALAIDKWNATQIATQLTSDGVNVEYFRQGFVSLSGPTKFLERIVMQGRLDHGAHPVLRWNARNVAVVTDAMENLKPVKDKSTGRIDGILATIMGIGVSDDYKETPPSVYERRGLV
jgi:phage terminase large subunit-like protein